MSIEPEEEKEIAQELPEVPVCPTGYYWDEETQKCILDVGGE